MKTYSNYFKLIFIAFIALVSCSSNKHSKQAELLKVGIHTTIVQEIIHTSQYSYLRLKELGNPLIKETDTLWVAVPIMESVSGDTLYYKGGFVMKDFKSKELNRLFKEVLFLDSLSRTSDFSKTEVSNMADNKYMPTSDTTMMGKSKIAKIEIKVEPLAGGISIADLYNKKASFSGKTIKVKGKVTKFSPEIMGKNWIHIQDGTESDGKYDLTITTDVTVKVGDVVAFEGVISLNKDLGYNYFYEVIMEEAKIAK